MSSSSTTTKPQDPAAPSTKDDLAAPEKGPAALEEDDEFEDFPVEDWPQEDAEGGSSGDGNSNTHLWEESWDDDDTSEDFSKQLKEELEKVKANK